MQYGGIGFECYRHTDCREIISSTYDTSVMNVTLK